MRFSSRGKDTVEEGKESSEYSAVPFLPEHISLKSLREAARGCQGCPLYRNATQPVFGEGRVSAGLVLVGVCANGATMCGAGKWGISSPI